MCWTVCVSTVVQVLQIWQTGSASEILASTMLASASQFYIISFIRFKSFVPTDTCISKEQMYFLSKYQ